MNKPTDTARVFKIPVVIGPNRLRGMREGAMLDGDQAVSDLYALIDLEAKEIGVSSTPKYRTDTASQLLRIYELSYELWLGRKEQDRTVGFVYEGKFASGRTLLMADPRLFLRFPSLQPDASDRRAESAEAESSFAPAA